MFIAFSPKVFKNQIAVRSVREWTLSSGAHSKIQASEGVFLPVRIQQFPTSSFAINEKKCVRHSLCVVMVSSQPYCH